MFGIIPILLLVNLVPFLLYLLSKKYNNKLIIVSKWIVLSLLFLFWLYLFLNAQFNYAGKGGESEIAYFFYVYIFVISFIFLFPQFLFFIYKGRKNK